MPSRSRLRSSKPPEAPPQQAQPSPGLIASNGVVNNITHTAQGAAARERAAAYAEQMANPQRQQQVQPQAPQQPVHGTENARLHVPKVAATPGAQNVVRARTGGPRPNATARDGGYRPAMAPPITRERNGNAPNARAARPPGNGTVRPSTPSSPARTQPQQGNPARNQGPAQAPNPARDQAPQAAARVAVPPPATQPNAQSQPLQVNPDAPVADVSAVIAVAFRPLLLRPQLEALGSGSVVPESTTIWINADGAVPVDVDALTQAEARYMRTNDNLGGWPRLMMGSIANTKYVLMLDDDCIIGSDWLRRAVDRLDAVGEDETPPVIACEGWSFSEDDPASIIQVGSETEEVEVDVGTRGWLMPTAMLGALNALPHPPGPEGMALFIGAAVANLGSGIIVLPMPNDDVEAWGAITPPDVPSLSTATEGYAERYAEAYAFYREAGWEPLVVMPEDDGQEQAEEATGEAEAAGDQPQA